jgi:hypothetical protein
VSMRNISPPVPRHRVRKPFALMGFPGFRSKTLLGAGRQFAHQDERRQRCGEKTLVLLDFVVMTTRSLRSVHSGDRGDTSVQIHGETQT